MEKSLKLKINKLLKANGISEMQGVPKKEMIDGYLKIPPNQREMLLSWYADNRWTVTKATKTWIDKNNFEKHNFYVSGSDVAITMLLLGFKVNSSREANVSERSMKRLMNKRRQGC